MSRAAAIIPAAGRGSRIGFKTPKTFIDLGGRAAAGAHDRRLRRQPAHRPDPARPAPDAPGALSLRDPRPLRAGAPAGRRSPAGASGRTRWPPACAPCPTDVDYVVIHDGARPFATTALVERVLAAARRHGAALAAVPVHDTLKRVSPDLFLDGTVDRRALWLAQTPQAFSVGLLREAHAQRPRGRPRGHRRRGARRGARPPGARGPGLDG